MNPKKPFSSTYPIGTVCDTIPPDYSGAILVFTPGEEDSELWTPHDKGMWLDPSGCTQSAAALQCQDDPRKCILLGNMYRW